MRRMWFMICTTQKKHPSKMNKEQIQHLQKLTQCSEYCNMVEWNFWTGNWQLINTDESCGQRKDCFFCRRSEDFSHVEKRIAKKPVQNRNQNVQQYIVCMCILYRHFQPPRIQLKDFSCHCDSVHFTRSYLNVLCSPSLVFGDGHIVLGKSEVNRSIKY